MSLDLREAASRLIDAGYDKDEVVQVINGLKDEAVTMRQKGTEIPAIEKQLAQRKFRDKKTGEHIDLFAQPEKTESAGLISNIAQEFGEGVTGALNPSEVKYLGSETIGKYSPFTRNLLGSLIGASQAAYAIPGGVAKTYVEEPLREAGFTKTAPYAGAAANIGLSLLGGPLSAAGATAKHGGQLLKFAGRLLDPVSAFQRGNAGLRGAVEGRREAVAQGTRNVAEKEAALAQAEQFAGRTPAMASAEVKAAEEQAMLAALQRVRPPAAPTAPAQVESLIRPKAAISAEAEQVGKQFKTTKAGATQKLFAESSANYEKIIQQYGGEALQVDDIKGIAGTITDMKNELRGTSAMKAVEGKTGALEAEVGGRPITGYGSDAVKFIEQQLAATEKLDVATAIRMKQRLMKENLASRDVGAINANRQVMRSIDNALDNVAGEAGEQLQAANQFHRRVHEVVGPKSLTERVFKMAPENVVDNVFLPEGKSTPNLTMINRAREVFMKENPEAWVDLTRAAMGKFGERIIDPATGVLDVQRFNRQFGKYENTFRAALSRDQFDALKGFQQTVQRFNQESRVFREIQAAQKSQEKVAALAVREVDRLTTGAGRTIKMAEKDVREAVAGLKQIEGTSRFSGVGGQLTSPYTMMALAQFGQALQATFTGSWGAASRQAAQGVVWYTLGNPDFVRKIIDSPKLTSALKVLTAKGPAPAGKVGNAMRAFQEAIDGEESNQ